MSLSSLTGTDSIKPLGFRIWAVDNSFREMARGHTHAEVEVNYLSSGSIEYLVGNRFEILQPGRLYLFWAGFPHQVVRMTQPEGIWMTIPFDRLMLWKTPNLLVDQLFEGRLVSVPDSEGDHRRRMTRWLADYESESDGLLEAAELEIRATLKRFGLILASEGRDCRSEMPKADGARRQVLRICQYLGDHYRESIDAESVARAVGLHPKYMLTLFRKACRLSFNEYLTRLRLAFVQALLQTTDRKVIDIVFESGFGSVSAYYHARKRFGGRDELS